MTRSAITLLALGCSLLGGCSAAARTRDADSGSCDAPLAAYARHVLYFGLSSPMVPGGVITDEVWAAFSEEVLTRHFPQGMTVFDAYGEWRRDDGTHYGEPTRVVVHLAPVTEDASAVASVEGVIAEAKERFAFQSVLWERSAVCVAF